MLMRRIGICRAGQLAASVRHRFWIVRGTGIPTHLSQLFAQKLGRLANERVNLRI
jgi:hypothetical protein